MSLFLLMSCHSVSRVFTQIHQKAYSILKCEQDDSGSLKSLQHFEMRARWLRISLCLFWDQFPPAVVVKLRDSSKTWTVLEARRTHSDEPWCTFPFSSWSSSFTKSGLDFASSALLLHWHECMHMCCLPSYGHLYVDFGNCRDFVNAVPPRHSETCVCRCWWCWLCFRIRIGIFIVPVQVYKETCLL